MTHNQVTRVNHDEALIAILDNLSSGFTGSSVKSRSGVGCVSPTENIEVIADIIEKVIEVTPHNIGIEEARKALAVLDARERAAQRLARKIEHIADPIPFHVGAKNFGVNFAHATNGARKKVVRKLRSLKTTEMSLADAHFSSIPRRSA